MAINIVLLLALFLLPAIPGRAADETPTIAGQATAIDTPAPQLVKLALTLTQKLDAKENGELTQSQYQDFLTGFRATLSATMARIPPIPENKALHAQILARLGDQDREQALAGLIKALKENPKNPTLLRASGQILFEQKDYPSAAEFARQAWEYSDQTDEASLTLLKVTEGRVSPIAASGISLWKHPSGAPGSREASTMPDYKRLNAEEVSRFVRLGKIQEPPLQDKNAPILENLIPHYALVQYTERDKADLAKAIQAAATASEVLHDQRPNVFADLTRGSRLSGPLANIPEGAAMIVRLMGEALGKPALVKVPQSRSCIEHVSKLQGPVIDSLPLDSRLRVTHVQLGRESLFEHHVLMIHPSGTNPVRSGIILDPWRRQTADPKQFVMAYTDFKAAYFLEVLGGESHEEVKHARRDTGR